MNSATPKEARRAVVQLTLLRILVYAILIFLSILCLFSFYMLFINATRSNGQLQAGFTLIPGGHLLDNLRNAWTDSSINIPRGLLNSFFVASCTAILTTYFSALTAYGFQAYDFKGKKFLFAFIMAIMVIPKQVSASGFVQLCYKYGLTNNYLVLILPGIAAPIVFFYIKQCKCSFVTAKTTFFSYEFKDILQILFLMINLKEFHENIIFHPLYILVNFVNLLIIGQISRSFG